VHVLKLRVERHQGAALAVLKTSVYGHPLELIVDTGGGRNMLPMAFVQKYKIEYRTSAADPRGVDVNGKVTSMPRAYGVPIDFQGAVAAEKIDFLVNPSGALGSQGLFIPQDLVTSGWVMVLDLEHEELRYEPEAEALQRIGPSLQELDYSTCELDNHRMTPVSVNGVASSLMIDSGASRTSLARNNEALPSMMSAQGKVGLARGVSSTGLQFTAKDVPVEFAKTQFSLTTMVLPASARCGRGLLGADVLNQCVVVWGANKLWASCHQ
jgi:hypothetical protein